MTRWLIDAILLKFTDAMLGDFRVQSFGSALLAALCMSAFGTIGQWLLMLLGVV
ncbi:MAG: hypothetical protein ABEN55_17885 [Bradymonadaceae bacterium]